ncbi:MAG TPA: Hpt domain-containing protein [Burkholderiales bacterium]|nr:Hpt domain-containing protein [Burkholderiales bacterium]
MAPSRHSVRVSGELRDLIPRFLANRRSEIARLREAGAKGDFAEARRIGHILKGAGGGYGFDEITRLGAEIERNAARGEDVRAPVEELAEYLELVEVTFD